MVLNTANIDTIMSERTGIRRFRFFLRFNTPGRRRLLVVQFVSVEVSAEVAEGRQALMTKPQPCHTWAESYSRLLHEYRAGVMLSRT
jgi:hypothetical protein